LFDFWVAILRVDSGAALDEARGVARSPGSPGSALLLGGAALMANRPREAIAALTSPDLNVATAGRYPPFWDQLGLAHHLLGDFRGELEIVRRGRKQHPEELLMLESEVRSLAALGRPDEVARRLDEALGLPPSAFVTVGQVMEEAAKELVVHAQADQARAVSARALAWWLSRPGADSTTSLTSGLALAGANYIAARYDESQGVVTALTHVSPGHPDVLGYQGVLAARRRDREAALTADTALAALREPYLAGRNTLWRARIAALLGDQERAVTLLQKAFIEGQHYIDLHDDVDLYSLHENSAFRDLVRPRG
jgi:tetratricopeptide (TPR) repeat protein